jgi:hypothetical protein
VELFHGAIQNYFEMLLALLEVEGGPTARVAVRQHSDMRQQKSSRRQSAGAFEISIKLDLHHLNSSK